MGHGFHGYVSQNQRVSTLYIYIILPIKNALPIKRMVDLSMACPVNVKTRWQGPHFSSTKPGR